MLGVAAYMRLTPFTTQPQAGVCPVILTGLDRQPALCRLTMSTQKAVAETAAAVLVVPAAAVLLVVE